MTSRVIAIDGPAGSGKSTTARAVAELLGLGHLDSGALYRAVTLVVLEQDIPLDGPRIAEVAADHGVGFREVDASLHPVRDGSDISREIRSDEVTGRVSAVAALPAVRAWVNEVVRQAARQHSRGVVADGRDIGSVVFPDAVLKVYLSASLEERARRRALERGGAAVPEDLAQVADDIRRRDEQDSNREASPLVVAPDAVQIDTTELGFEDQVAAVVDRAQQLFD